MQFFSRQRSSVVVQYWGSRLFTPPERSTRILPVVLVLPQAAKDNAMPRASTIAAPRRSILFFGLHCFIDVSFFRVVILQSFLLALRRRRAFYKASLAPLAAEAVLFYEEKDAKVI